jgi:hypothetical protein
MLKFPTLACIPILAALPAAQQTRGAAHSPYSLLLDAPSGLRGEPCGGTMELSWLDHSAGELGFVVLRRAAGTGSFQEVALTAPDATRFVDTPPSGTFEYAVAARALVGGRPFDTWPTPAVQASFPNAPPVITCDLPARPFTGGAFTRFQVTVNDPDGDPVSLRLLNPQAGMLFVPFRDRPSPATLDVRWERDTLGLERRPEERRARLVFESSCGVRLEKTVEIPEPGQTGVLTGDVTGDGRLDLVVTAERAGLGDEGAVYVFAGAASLQGDPSAELTVPGDSLRPRNPWNEDYVQLADLDGDGRLDVVVHALSQKIYVWAGGPALIGTPAPTAVLSPPGTSGTPAAFGDNIAPLLQFADFDQDGIDDLVTIDRFADAAVADSGAAFLWLGGPGLAGAVAPTRVLSVPGAAPLDWMGRGQNFTRERSLSLGDVTGDGVLDFIVLAPLAKIGAIDDAGALYLFDGAAVLAGNTAPAATLTTPLCAFCTGEPMLGDLTGDGSVDVVAGSPRIGTAGETFEGFYQLWAGPSWSGVKPATATFRTNEITALGSDLATLADLDGDGRLDFIAGTGVAQVAGFARGVVYVWRGGALAGTPAPSARLVAPVVDGADQLVRPLVHDVDRDGKPDIVAFVSDFNTGLFGERAFGWRGGPLSGVVAPVTTLGSAQAPVDDVRFEDLDGDNIEDVLGSGDRGFALWSGAAGVLGTPAPSFVFAGTPGHVLARSVDLDGDGFSDLLFQARRAPNDLLLWRCGPELAGSSAPHASYLLHEGARPSSLAFHDIDGDGRLDLLAAMPHVQVGSVVGAGRIDVWLGRAEPTGILALSGILQVNSARRDDRLGYDGVRFVDLDGDGRLEILALSPFRSASAAATETGAVHAWSGATLLPGTNPATGVFADPDALSSDRLGYVFWP